MNIKKGQIINVIAWEFWGPGALIRVKITGINFPGNLKGKIIKGTNKIKGFKKGQRIEEIFREEGNWQTIGEEKS